MHHKLSKGLPQAGKNKNVYLPSLKLTWHFKMMVSNRNLLLQRCIFRCYVSFKQGSMFRIHLDLSCDVSYSKCTSAVSHYLTYGLSVVSTWKSSEGFSAFDQFNIIFIWAYTDETTSSYQWLSDSYHQKEPNVRCSLHFLLVDHYAISESPLI